MADFDEQSPQLGLAHARTLADNERMRRIAWLGLLALAACDRTGSTNFDLSPLPPDMAQPIVLAGTIDGQPFPIAATTFYSFGPSVVQLSTDGNACSDQVGNVLKRGARDLLLQTNANWAAMTYTITTTTPGAGQAIAYWRAVGSDCGVANGNAVSGSIVISAVGSNAVKGTIDLTFDVGSEHVSGDFTAFPCVQNGNNPPVTCP